MATPIDAVVFKCRKIGPTGNRWNRAIFTGQNFPLPLKLSLLRGLRPKSARASPQHLAHNVPNVIEIGPLSAELQPNAWMLFFWPIEYLHNSTQIHSKRIKISPMRDWRLTLRHWRFCQVQSHVTQNLWQIFKKSGPIKFRCCALV